jgi:hypothetical protein
MKQVMLHFNEEKDARFVARELSKLAEQTNNAADKSNDVEDTELLSKEAQLLEATSIEIRQGYGDLFMYDTPADMTSKGDSTFIPKPELQDRPDCKTAKEIEEDIICDIDYDFNMAWAELLSAESNLHELGYRTKGDHHIALWKQIKEMRMTLNKAHNDLMEQHNRKPGVYTTEIIADHMGDS